jgi:hypothetical protein
MSILGFQVVLLDEQGVELQRIPDVFYDDPWIFMDDQAYGMLRVKMEGGQRVRYFMRDPDVHVHKTRDVYDRLTTNGRA